MPYSQKYYTAMELQQSLLRDVKDSPEQMKKVLTTGSNLYRLPFAGQLMVSHCKPDTVMVAGYDQWKRLSCVVKRGSHGIAIPNSDGTLSYVFDVNDTIVVTTPDKRPERWEFQQDMEKRVSERLDREFGLSKKAYSLSEQIMILSERFARELMEDSDFREEVYGDENLLPETVQDAETTMSSIMAYSVMKRMNLDTDYFEKTGRINFEYTKNLSDEVFLRLAEAISQQSGEVLHAAALEVIAIRKEASKRSSQYHRNNDIPQKISVPVQVSGQMESLVDSDQSNSLYVTSLNRERTENGNFPMIPDQAEQIGNIIAGMLKEGTAPEELKKALDIVFSYIPDEEKAAISFFYKENGTGSRFRDVIHNRIKKHVPILDSDSDGIRILDDKGERIDLTWRSVEDIIEHAIRQGNFVDEQTENRVREELENSKANILEGKIIEWSQDIKNDAIR